MVLAPMAAGAQSFDGAYTGTIGCGLLSTLTRPLKTEFTMTVSGPAVRYERPIVTRNGPTNSYERGGGTITESGEIALTGKGEGNFVFEGEYRGRLEGGTARLTGTQRWLIRGVTETRSCEIELTAARSRS
jgi:hypothetical protein